jgi:hypothetical protein
MESLTDIAKQACEMIGSSYIRKLTYRSSWCIIGEKGAFPGKVPESYKDARDGPSDLIRHKVTFSPDALLGYPSSSTKSRFKVILPSNGRWLRLRKNDGALSRVPPSFYPKVWQLLSETQGLLIGTALLPRDPTISEKTPEELNFGNCVFLTAIALQTESILDQIVDPAERQIVVECIVVISKINHANPLTKLKNIVLKISEIIRLAIKAYWAHLVSENPQFFVPQVETPTQLNGMNSKSSVFKDSPSMRRPNSKATAPLNSVLKIGTENPRLSETDHRFEANEKFARLLFLDLPLEGKIGTLNFLAAACMNECFEVELSSDDLVPKLNFRE